MRVIEKIYLSPEQKLALLKLWNSEYPANICFNPTEFENYLTQLNDKKHLLLIDELERIAGWFFTFVREGEKWFAMIIRNDLQGTGLGTQFLNNAKKSETILNGWVVDHENYLAGNGKPYRSPIGFYLKNGFKICSEIRLETEKLSAVKILWEREPK